MRNIFLAAFMESKMDLPRTPGAFELFGVDFMIDSDLKVWLIEINTNPALWTDTSTQLTILPKLISDTIQVELGMYGYESGEPLEGTGWSVIYTEGESS
jgi:hypothetical protein